MTHIDLIRTLCSASATNEDRLSLRERHYNLDLSNLYAYCDILSCVIIDEFLTMDLMVFFSVMVPVLLRDDSTPGANLSTSEKL